MQIAKRLFLFLAVNFLIILTLSFILNILGVQPYLTQNGIDTEALMVFCVVWGMGGAFISLLLSKTLAKWTMGVKIISLNAGGKEGMLLEKVRALSQKARLPSTPEVGIFPSNQLNAFATGYSKNSALVAVSSELLNAMSEDELEGVLAHEITHIANGDMVTMTLIQGIVNAFVMFFARMIAYALLSRNNNSNRRATSSFAYYFTVMALEAVFMLLGALVVAAFSRGREFRADKGGGQLAGKEKMIKALEHLQNVQAGKRTSMPEEKETAISALMIMNKPKGMSKLLALYATHPSLDARINALKLSR